MGWSQPKRVSPPINESNPTKTANYQPFITFDGKEFYFTRVQQLMLSNRRPAGGWGEPRRVFPQFPACGHASVTADGRHLYFLAAKDKASLKRQHWTIWHATRQRDGTWDEPQLVD